MIRFFLTLFVMGALFAVAFLNQDQAISLHFFGGMETTPLPVFLISTSTFVIGFLLATLYFFPGWIRSILAGRKQSKRIEQLEIDLDRIRSAAAKEESPPFSKPSPH